MCFKLSRYQLDFVHFVLSALLSIGVPLLMFWLAELAGFQLTHYVYLAISFMLLVIGVLIITECIVALCHPGPPENAGSPAPNASAIICAYMPNEQYTIKETILHFLSLKYDPGLEIILAYNSPFYCPVEAELKELTELHPNFILLKVKESRSKAENLNTALKIVTGTFVGCFDADHMPDDGSFERAWRWLSNGYDVVQGHCLVRNPEESFWAKMVAIEFETIYALAHPGRTVRDGFGVFGGSNGYWKTSVLQKIGMVGAMLTEDIDSSMRVLEDGGRIGTDPHLISRELATSTFVQVWNQRLRWAQGWLQVSLKHCLPLMRSPHFGIQEKFGAFMLLFVREIYPWISVQIIPVVIYAYLSGNTPEWGVELFIGTSVFTAAIGPFTVIVAYWMADPSLKKPLWFLVYMFFSLCFYTELKNVMCRVALIKQIFGETAWRVTPRSATSPVKDPEQFVEDETEKTMDASAYSRSGMSCRDENEGSDYGEASNERKGFWNDQLQCEIFFEIEM